MLSSPGAIVRATAASLLLLAPLVRCISFSEDGSTNLIRRYIPSAEEEFQDGHKKLAKLKLWLKAHQERGAPTNPITQHNIDLLKKWATLADYTLGTTSRVDYAESKIRAPAHVRALAEEVYGPEWETGATFGSYDNHHFCPHCHHKIKSTRQQTREWKRATQHTGELPPNIDRRLEGKSGINYPTAFGPQPGGFEGRSGQSPVPKEFDLDADKRKAEAYAKYPHLAGVDRKRLPDI